MVNCMVKHKFKFVVDDKKIVHKSRTIPDQSMSIHELVRRFVRGIPADVVQRDAVYNPNNNQVDLEALSRLDPADKAFEAAEMKARNDADAAELQRIYDESITRKQERERAANANSEGFQDGSGVESLDNTTPDDTGSDSQSVSRGKKSKK